MMGKKEYLSIEIGVNFLKVAYLQSLHDGVDVKMSKSVDIVGMTTEQVASELSAIVSNVPNASRINVVNILPADFAIFKNIEIPSTDEKEINDIIDLQAGRHTPYSRDEIVIDFINLGIVHDSNAKVLLVIVKRDVVIERYKILEKAGLKSGKTILSSEAITKFFAKVCGKDDGKPVVLVDIDSHHSDFIIEQGGECVFLRSIPIGSVYAATDAINSKKKFLEEIKRSIEVYQTENIGLMPQKINITGSIEWISSYGKEIETQTNMAVKFMRISEFLSSAALGIVVPVDRKEVSVIACIIAPVVLSELSLELIPEDLKLKLNMRQKAKDMTILGAMGVICILIFCTVLFTNMIFKSFYFNRLLTSYTKELNEAEKMKMLSEKTGTVEGFILKKGESLDLLKELVDALPGEVYLNNVNYDGEQIMSFTATTDNMSRVFSLVTDLENNKYFSNVKVDSTRSRRVENKEVTDFGLTLSIEEGI
ncbi:MAG: pilus assembly protein PilM [Candidatus Omnitrophica bacterium]|nr:pilus assembly protein PilM [Candidatus Omnitrophota bacterium]